MISPEEIEIYQALTQEKGIAEKILGYASFSWNYASVTYQADCTYGIPFDLFDKVIVGILQVDDQMSIEDIGEVLGMNIIHDPDNFKIKDEAEYDILRIALDNLVDFEMIQVGDIYYSACRLTPIGREYALKGRKFRTERNKSFTLYFDHTSEDHLNASKNFKYLKGLGIPLEEKGIYLDDYLMRSVAAVQVPDIYDMDKGNSFIHAEIDYRKSNKFTLKVWIAILFDLEREKPRLIAINPTSKKELPFATAWFNEFHLEEVISNFGLNHTIAPKIEVQIGFEKYCKNLVNTSFEVQQILESDPETALTKTKRFDPFLDFIDKEFIWLNLQEIITENIKEIFFFLTDPSPAELAILQQFGKKTRETACYIVINPSSTYGVDADEIHRFAKKLNDSNANFYCLVTSGLRGDEIWLVEENEVHRYKPEQVSLNTFNQRLPFEILSKSHIHREKAERNIGLVKTNLASKVIEEFHSKVFQQVIEALADEVVTKEKILKYAELPRKIDPLENYLENDQLRKTYFTVKEEVMGLISSKKEILQDQLVNRAKILTDHFEAEKFEDLDKLHLFGEKVKELEIELFEEFDNAKRLLTDLQKKTSEKERFLKNLFWAKTYIIDTNVFIEDPDIISKIDEKHSVALNLMVIEELDRLKTNKETRDNAKKAIRNIHSVLRTVKGKQSRVRKAKSSLKLLPEELQVKSADNYILSIAVVYKDKNPVLLTFDKNLQSKAMLLDIPTETPSRPTTGFSKSNLDYVNVFKGLKPNKNGDIPIGAFIDALQNTNPDFNFRSLGFEKAWQFVESLSLFEVIRKQFMKLKK